MSAGDIVRRYHQAWKAHDYDSVRALLHDDLSFRGPFDAFDNADDFVESIRGLAPIVKDVRVLKLFEDGDDVCLLLEMETNTPAGTQPIAEWHRVRGDKMAGLQAYFDTRPFATLRE
jgi:ketosteroid isomerase-like protein